MFGYASYSEVPFSALPSAAGPVTYNATLTETATATDAVTSVATFNSSRNESATATDLFSVLATFNSTLGESATATDAFTAVNLYSFTLTETATATDSFVPVATFNSSLSDSVAATDSFVPTATFNNSLADSASASDAVSVVANYNVSLSDGATATDVFAAVNLFTAALTETATATDAQSIVVTFNSSIFESASATDTQTAVITITASLTESTTATDAQTITGSFSISLTETATATDNQTVVATYNASRTESATATDAQTVSAAFNLSLTETATATDAQTVSATFSSSLTESATATDNATISVIFNATLSEGAIALDTLGSTSFITLTETATLTDAYSARLLWELIPTDQPVTWTNVATSHGTWSAVDNSQNSGGWSDITTTYSVSSPLSASQVGSVWVPYTTPILATELAPSRLKTIEGVYYAVGDATVSKSINGAVWTYSSVNILGGDTIADIAYHNGLWVVVGTNGALATSIDFQTWTLRTSSTTTNLEAVQYVSLQDFSGFVAAGTMTVLYSHNGITWTSATNPMVSLQRPRDIVTIGGRALICSGYSDFTFYTRVQVISSTDGANWSTSLNYTNTALSLIPAVSAAYDPSTGRVYVVSRGDAAKAQISYTSDGVNWTTFNSTTSFTGLYFYGAAFSSSGVFVVANRTASLRYSLDHGVTWTTAQSSLGGSIPGSGRGVAYNEFEGGYGFVGSSQNIYFWLSQTTTPVWGTFPTVFDPTWGLVS